jgi:hypothetical protein
MSIYTTNGMNQKTEYMCHDVISWTFKELDLFDSDLRVDFIWKRKQKHKGYTVHVDDNEFEIEIQAGLDTEDLIRTIIHELIHVQQQVSGKLKHDGFISYWDGEVVIPVQYEETPWEIDAYSREDTLYEKWCLHQHQKVLYW